MPFHSAVLATVWRWLLAFSTFFAAQGCIDALICFYICPLLWRMHQWQTVTCSEYPAHLSSCFLALSIFCLPCSEYKMMLKVCCKAVSSSGMLSSA